MAFFKPDSMPRVSGSVRLSLDTTRPPCSCDHMYLVGSSLGSRLRYAVYPIVSLSRRIEVDALSRTPDHLDQVTLALLQIGIAHIAFACTAGSLTWDMLVYSGRLW